MNRQLRTLAGSIIKRANPVGKQMGSQFYFHRDYVGEVLGSAWWEAEVLPIADANEFTFTCVMFDTKKPETIRLDAAPGFDHEREPKVVECLTISGREVRRRKTSAIWHHKWMWVKDDYEGFDVDESFAWSARWLAVLTEPANGSSSAGWEKQLRAAGLIDCEQPTIPLPTPTAAAPPQTRSQLMHVENRPAGTIRPYHRNPRDNAAAIQDAARSIREFGWQQPIVVDREGVILVGHTRYLAGLSLGYLEMPVQVAEHLSPEQAAAYRLADNKVGERATWNLDLLRLELSDLQEMEIVDLESTGFRIAEIEDILEDPPEPREPKEWNEYGGATALSRGSVPLRFWRDADLLQGRVLDYGAGKEQHEFVKYDMVTQPDPTVLMDKYDVVMCNYCLNVQPSDHLIDLILVNLWHLVEDSGRVLISVLTDGDSDGKAACGGREHKTPSEWKAIIDRFFDAELVKDSFTGFVCTKKHRGE